MKISPYDTCLTDFQWEIVKPLLPEAAKTGRPRTCLREVIDAIFFLTKSGSQWRLLPNEFPNWKTVYHHFRVWSQGDLWEVINAALRDALRKLQGKKTTPSAAVIDSQTVRSAAHGGKVGYDAGKKTKGRKRFLCVDTLGLILGVFLTSANTPERAGAKDLLKTVLKEHHLLKIWADGGFSHPLRSRPLPCPPPLRQPIHQRRILDPGPLRERRSTHRAAIILRQQLLAPLPRNPYPTLRVDFQ